jgi:hypothetical protein
MGMGALVTTFGKSSLQPLDYKLTRSGVGGKLYLQPLNYGFDLT